LASVTEKNPRARRDYRPTVEGLEELRLLSSATQAHALSDMASDHNLVVESHPRGDASPAVAVSTATWDEALVQTELAELLNPSGNSAASTVARTSSPQAATKTDDPVALASGLSQLNKYLNRAWFRGGIPVQLHDDSTQAVYAALLQNMGRPQFDSLVTHVGHWGIKDVFSRETADGVAFFRAVDMVKKRAQRERTHQSLESIDLAGDEIQPGNRSVLRDALREAIHQTLSPREAALIEDTLMGKTPAEIASQWGVAPKTVSNEKTRVLQKLRSVLADYQMN
jgi:RNA polymerase sigma factor (sigma-70 family)